MSSDQDQMRKPLYKNWVKGGLAYKYLRDGLEEFTDNAVNHEHVRIIEDTRKKNIKVCNKCNIDNLKPKHTKYKDERSRKCRCPYEQKRCNCLLNGKTECPEGFCDEIHHEILTHHASTPPTPNWNNTDINEWCSKPWEIAKCYINAPGYIGKKAVNEIDIAGILHVFINNTRLHSYLDCQFNNDNVFSKTLQGRNKIFHSPSLELSRDELAIRTNDMIVLLEDKKGLSQNSYAKQAVENIKELRRNDIYITTQNEAEVFKDVIVSINKTVEEIKELVENKKLDSTSKREEEEAYIKYLETVLSEQQKTMGYISQKQELQKSLIEKYQTEDVKTWISPLVTRENNIDINRVYVHPKMFIDDSEKGYIGDYSQRRVETFHDIFCDIENEIGLAIGDNNQSNGTQHGCHDKLKNIYIIGEVGTGKSALCKMMIYLWCNTFMVKQNDESINEKEKSLLGLHNLSRYEFLFYVQMCYIPGDIDDLLKMIIYSMKGIASSSLIESVFYKESERCLIIVDGLDEWSQQEHPNRSLRHIKTGIPLSNTTYNATVITTSTPSSKGILNLKCSQYNRKIKLDGIEENELPSMVKQYMETFGKCFSSKTATYMEFVKDLKAANFPHPERTPLLLQQVLYLYCNGKQIHKYITYIYINNVNTMFGWFEEKENEPVEIQKNCSSDFDCLQLPKALDRHKRYSNNQELVLMLGKLAYHTLTSVPPIVNFGRSSFTECNLPYESLLKSALMFGLMVKENCLDPTDEKTQVSFTHISFRNFFAAVYVSSHFHRDDNSGKIIELGSPVLDELCKHYNSMEKILQLSSMLVMICGMNPVLIELISKRVHDIVLTDSNRSEYITDLECGETSDHSLKEIQEIQYLSSKMLSECHYEENRYEEHRISMVDIVLRNEVNLKLLREVIPETVQSLNIDRCLLNDDTVGVISRLNYIQTLAITNKKKLFTKPSELLPNADSILQAILYNEDLDIDLSRHKNLQNVTLDKCKHMFVSSVSSELLSSCEIIGLALSHQHFSLIMSLLSNTETLALRNINCDLDGCKNHKIDLSENTKLHTLTLEDCSNMLPTFASTCALESVTIHQCQLSHEQYKEFILKIEEISSLVKLEIDNLKCDDDCDGHDIDLSKQQYLERLCLKNCKYLAFKNLAHNQMKCCTIRHCSFLHDQCVEIGSLLTQTISLQIIELSRNTCSVERCDHCIDLSNNKQLQRVLFIDNCLYPNKLNTNSLQEVISYVTRSHTLMPEILKNATNLTELTIEATSQNTTYTMEMDSVLHTFISLRRLELCKVDIEHTALTISSRMKSLNYIKLWLVNMSESTWRLFLNSLGKLSQDVNIKTKEMSVATNDRETHASTYVIRNSGKFSVTQDPDCDFSFKSKGCELRIAEC